LPCHGEHVSITLMRRNKVQISEHTLSPTGKPALRIALPPGETPAAGQPILAYLPGSDAALRTALYASRIDATGFTSVEIPSPAWSVGSVLDLLGPIGRGFSPAPQAKRWLIIALDQPVDRLLPLVDLAVASDISVVLYSDGQLPALPAQVEIATALEDVIQWADYIAMDTKVSSFANFTEMIRNGSGFPPAAQIEALLDLSLACGLGVCDGCALRQRGGWLLACQDGPVIDIKDWVS
jgi:hypothetical protein